MELLTADEDTMDQGVAHLIQHNKRPLDDEDRDQDPPAGSNQGLKKRKTSDDAQLSKRPKSTGDDTGNTDAQPDVEAVTKDDWFKKPARPPTPDLEWI
ncbi:hypothetical protein Tco_0245651 [Tanacetum coccineum]